MFMTAHRVLCAAGRQIVNCSLQGFLTLIGLGCVSIRRRFAPARHPSQRLGHVLERRREIRDGDECEQQSGDPEEVIVGEQGYKRQDGDDLELDLLSLVRNALRQGMQREIEDYDSEHHQDQEHNHDVERHVGFARRSDEHGQMVGRIRMDRCSRHGLFPVLGSQRRVASN